MFAPELIVPALKQSFVKLSPKMMYRNPVMFTVEIGTLVMFLVTIYSYSVHDSTVGRFGYNLVIFVAALQSIPKTLREAARVDGANVWQEFWLVVVPLLRRTGT